jgi:hypothetical protein
VRIDLAQYQASGGGILRVLGTQRRAVRNAFKDTGYFINDHHASQFRKTFPQIWSALEQGVSSSAQSAFKSALRVLQSSAPTTFISLQKAGIIY